MSTKGSRLLTVATAIAGGATALACAAYRKDIKAAMQRIETNRQFIDSPDGPIEFAEAGNGAAALVSHGAGGGFDQGLALGRMFLGDAYRIIAPSRFGYLGTPLPPDASPEAQADAHVRLLDALQLDRVAVLGISAGAPSAIQLSLRHPSRCSALVLGVPMAWAPNGASVRGLSPLFVKVLNVVAESDFLFWTATKVAHATVVRTILGTPIEVYRNASRSERRNVDEILRSILPISRRAAGLHNDAFVGSTIAPYRLEDVRVPTLLITAADDGYCTYESSLYTAEQIPAAEFVGFRTGGHLLVGHDDEVRSLVTMFLREHVAAPVAPEPELVS